MVFFNKLIGLFPDQKMDIQIFENSLKELVYILSECIPGSHVKETDFGLLLKNHFNHTTYTNFTIINFVTKIYEYNINEIESFYHNNSFVVYFIQPEFKTHFPSSHYKEETFKLMYLPLDTYIPRIHIDVSIQISHVSISNFCDYYEILNEQHPFSYEDAFILFSGLSSNLNCIFLIAYMNQVPVSIKTVLFHDHFAQEFLTVTKKSFQRKGIGTALMNHVLQISKGRGLKYFILKATEVGVKAWSKLGFVSSNTLYCLKRNKLN